MPAGRSLEMMKKGEVVLSLYPPQASSENLRRSLNADVCLTHSGWF